VAGPITVAVALGSNVGNRVRHLDHAVSRLAVLLDALRVSRYYETAPAGAPDGDAQPMFLNAAASGTTRLSARDLLAGLHAIEGERGRERPYVNAPRTLDLDLVLFGDVVIDEPGLVVPHPRFRERRFVLEPLAEIAPAMVDPVTGKTVTALLSRVTA
jgi:2-amino-4-hydroxy-6-hydroxymethyldihydropteridine diphosphokinase